MSYSPQKEYGERKWWKHYGLPSESDCKIAALKRADAYMANLYDIAAHDIFLRFRREKVPNPDQAAWWLTIYAYVTQRDDRYDATTLHPWYATDYLAAREQWFALVKLPLEDRLSYHGPVETGACFSAYEMDNAQFWRYVLRRNKRRFVDNVPIPEEAIPEDRRCTASGCFGERSNIKVSTKEGNTGYHYCTECLEKFCCQPIDKPAKWYKIEVCYSAIDSNTGNKVFFSSESARQRATHACPACGSLWTEEVLECGCGYSVMRDIVNRDHNAKAPAVKLYATDEPEHRELFGIELEVEYGKSVKRGRTLKEVYDDKIMTVKYDGSLGEGCEIVTAPGSYRWWKEHADEWSKRLDAMRNAGFRSYDSGRCGMHVHISRDAFTPSSLLRLHELVFGNPDLFIMISQRGNNLKFCRFDANMRPPMDRGFDGLDKRSFVRKARIVAERDDESLKDYSKYAAIHVHPLHPTVEIRMFRGTLNVASFWKNLECAKALVDFVNSHTAKDMTSEAYVAHVVANEKQFPHLSAFITTDHKKPKPTKADNEPIHPEKLKRMVTPESFSVQAC